MDDPCDPWGDPPSMDTIESRAKTIWTSPIISWALIGVTFACCMWFWFWPPLPGIAVTVLGGMVSVMAFREMHNTHKLLATLAIFVLMGIELRDIRKDRIKSDTEQAAARAASEANFKAIGNGISSAIAQSQNQFSTTVQHVDHVSGLAEKALNNITGADSIPYLAPQGGFAPIGFFMWNDGKNLLSGVSLTIQKWTESGLVKSKELSVGVLHPGWGKSVDFTISPAPDKSGMDVYEIEINTQSEFFTEIVQFRKGTGSVPWASRYWVVKHIFGERSASPRLKSEFVPSLMDPKYMPKNSSTSVPVLGRDAWSDGSVDKPTKQTSQ
jgi:hypothetical protein